MIYFKAYPNRNLPPPPSEWGLELYDFDLSSSNPDDDIIMQGFYQILFNVDTDASAVDNNNNIGLIAQLDESSPFYRPEPYKMNASMQITINSYCLVVYIVGRIHFSDSDSEHIAIGEMSGASRQFVGDYRNTDIRITDLSGCKYVVEYKDGNGDWQVLVSTDSKGIPVEWEEGHIGEWQYITAWDKVPVNDYVCIGKWYGGIAYHQFDGHVNYLKVR